MERPLAYKGRTLTVAFGLAAVGDSPALAFYEDRSVRDKAKLLKLFGMLGDRGWINNDQKFKPIEGTKFFEFKESQIRMPCFRDGNVMVITHGFFKKKDRIPPAEITRAERLMKEDLAIAALEKAKHVQ